MFLVCPLERSLYVLWSQKRSKQPSTVGSSHCCSEVHRSKLALTLSSLEGSISHPSTISSVDFYQAHLQCFNFLTVSFFPFAIKNLFFEKIKFVAGGKRDQFSRDVCAKF